MDVVNPASMLVNIPDGYKPAAALAIGAVILVAVVSIHGMGLHRILLRHKRWDRRLRSGQPHLVEAILLFGSSVFFMLALHLTDIMIWAFALQRLGLIPRAREAVYFCANTYTALGSGGIDLGPDWRALGPVVTISGLFTFAWTTSSLVDVVRIHTRLLDQLEDERERQLELRRAAHRAEADVVNRERVAEGSAREQVRHVATRSSWLGRYKAWRMIRRQMAAMRAREREELAAIRHKERRAEETLGTGNSPPEDSDGESR
jgi:hypothetical protein